VTLLKEELSHMGFSPVEGSNPNDMMARMKQMAQMREAFGASQAASPKAVQQPAKTEMTPQTGLQQGGGNTNAFSLAAKMTPAAGGIDFGAIAKIGAPKGVESGQAVGPAVATNKAIDLNGNGAQRGGIAMLPGGRPSVVGSKFMGMG
jgi:hypothetical protein